MGGIMRNRFSVLLWSAAFLLPGVSSAQQAMLTQVGGDVQIAGKEGNRAAVPFLKVSTGDKLTLPTGGRLQVVYFGNGRQETWAGPGEVEIAGLEGRSALKPDVKQLPPLVVNQLAKTPAAGQQGKAGMILVRALEDPDALDHLDKQYAELKGVSSADDTTPEVFLLSGLIELKEVKRAKELLQQLSDKPGYKPVVDHFSPMVNR
jgi:hypothetical protein